MKETNKDTIEWRQSRRRESTKKWLKAQVKKQRSRNRTTCGLAAWLKFVCVRYQFAQVTGDAQTWLNHAHQSWSRRTHKQLWSSSQVQRHLDLLVHLRILSLPSFQRKDLPFYCQPPCQWFQTSGACNCLNQNCCSFWPAELQITLIDRTSRFHRHWLSLPGFCELICLSNLLDYLNDLNCFRPG